MGTPNSEILKSVQFQPVIDLPQDYEVYDFTEGYDPDRTLRTPFGIGKYNEIRPTMYVGEQYGGVRNIHMGVDFGCPIGTPVKAIADGKILYMANNDQEWDYGHTLVTHHNLKGLNLYVLLGHLSKRSLQQNEVGHSFLAGEVIAWVGNKSENGGWNPHLHFQLSWEDPKKADMPGVVSQKDHEEALKKFPDPRLVLGSIY